MDKFITEDSDIAEVSEIAFRKYGTMSGNYNPVNDMRKC